MPVRRRRPHRCPPLSPTGSLAHRPSSTRRTAAAPRNHRGEALAGSAREEEQDATHLEIRPTTALPSLLIEDIPEMQLSFIVSSQVLFFP
ncbi:hypothetical protein U9M48_005884 [Paspalum notatum var. saurae]|uniref:Uncharacterized protein n=1 Tax=Paspalum notatum var. saurae TaxID=547442 RepID=A0AAQ3SKB7_PASNO